MIQDAEGWCTGMTQRDGMGRELGGGFSEGNACTPMVDSSQCMAKPIQYCKVKFKTKKKKRWQGYTEELHKKDLHNPDIHVCVITHLEPDTLECEVK